MILLFSDFGYEGPYVGQMKLALAGLDHSGPVIDLMHDAPVFDAKASAYLLASLLSEIPENTVLLGVVDPGVGSQRRPLALQADGRWYVGPDNGLFELVMRRARDLAVYEIIWRPERLSSSFHGRDLFAPLAAQLSRGDLSGLRPLDRNSVSHPDWPDDWEAVIYLDRFGNAVTGIRAACLDQGIGLEIEGRRLPRFSTFSEAEHHQIFCYENSTGLMEIAMNQGNATQFLKIRLGMPVVKIPSDSP
ncbi:MAG: SAM-dependent chlorinase/fluorinase [Alphaproteobacteria bacterium]|nr:SAM-dependent chlorinase/fluorinase [Alphaproteobacteria bacterium]